MPTLERDDVESSLTKKGFKQETGGDHRFFKLMVKEKYTGIFTKTSHGSKKYRTLGNDLVKKMASQVKLTTPEFQKLVDCSMTGEEYVALLRERGEEL
ncbi:MAG: hypothetical protein HYZ29_31065 [Myxococcales bacterium]|nr:hypothetical protein [Myxococcales bacterium]